MGTEFFHSGGKTDRYKDVTKLVVAFRNFANAPNLGVRIFECPVLYLMSLFWGGGGRIVLVYSMKFRNKIDMEIGTLRLYTRIKG